MPSHAVDRKPAVPPRIRDYFHSLHELLPHARIGDVDQLSLWRASFEGFHRRTQGAVQSLLDIRSLCSQDQIINVGDARDEKLPRPVVSKPASSTWEGARCLRASEARHARNVFRMRFAEARKLTHKGSQEHFSNVGFVPPEAHVVRLRTRGCIDPRVWQLHNVAPGHNELS